MDVDVVDEEIEDNELKDDSVVVVGSNNFLVVALSFFAERSKYHTGGQELSVPLISVGSWTGFHPDGGARLLIDGSKYIGLLTSSGTPSSSSTVNL